MAKIDRRSAANAVALNASYEFGTALVQFVVQVYVTRVYLDPKDFGAANIVGWALAAAQPFSAAAVMRRIQQLPGDVVPDWGRHFRLAAVFQAACMAAVLAYAALLTRSPAHVGIPPLLALAVVGMGFDILAQLRLATLLRALNFRRYRLVLAATKALGLATFVALAVAGHATLGLVLMNSLVTALVLAMDGVLARCWRQPPPSPPESYAKIARFAVLQAGAGAVFSARGVLDSALLPRWLGQDGIGLWARAPALFATTAGRVQAVVGESIVPMLPHTAHEPARFRTLAIAYLETIALLAIPSALFLACFGPTLNLALYGPKWAEVNPLLVAGALLPALQAFNLAVQNILFARGRVRLQVALACAGSAFGAAALVGAWHFRTPFAFGCCLAAAEGGALLFALRALAGTVGPGAFRKAAFAPTVAGLLALGLAMAADRPCGQWPNWLRIALNAACFGAAFAAALRWLFPAWLAETLARLPRSRGLLGFLRLPQPA